MAIDFKALGAKAASTGVDMTKSQAGGGDYEPPSAGPGMCRFIGYVEIGKQKGMMKGKEEVKEKVMLIFELVGKRHAVGEDQQPHRVTIVENYSLNEKANLFKLFNRMNYRQDCQHLAQLLGEGYKCEVVHDKWTGKDGKERTDVTLRNEAGYTIAPPRKEDEDSETGWVNITVPAARSDIRCFMWNFADLEQWGGLFIEGEYPERKNDKGEVTAPARSKNVLQNKIKGAVNFIGSPIHTLLVSGGQPLDLPEVGEEDDAPAEAPSAPPATLPVQPDRLGGIV